MPQTESLELIQLGLSLPQWFGIGTLGALLGLFLTLYVLLPKLTILQIEDKSAAYNFESRIIVQNIGRLRAHNVWANVLGVDLSMHQIVVSGTDSIHGGHPTTLDPQEKMEVPVVPHIWVSPGIPLDKCTYTLDLEYTVKIFFYKRTFHRYWRIELRKWNNGFTWQFDPVSAPPTSS